MSPGRLLQFRFFSPPSIDFLGFQLIIPVILTACGYQSSPWYSRDEAECQKGDRNGANQSQRWPFCLRLLSRELLSPGTPTKWQRRDKVSMFRDFWNVLTAISLDVSPWLPSLCITYSRTLFWLHVSEQNRKFQQCFLGSRSSVGFLVSRCRARAFIKKTISLAPLFLRRFQNADF